MKFKWTQYKWLAVLLLWGVSSQGFSKDISEKELVNLQKKLKRIKSIQFQFEINDFKKMRNRYTKSYGTASFSRPDKFIWNHKHPNPKKIIYNGKKAKVIEKGRETVAQSLPRENKRLLDEIVKIVLDFNTLLDSYRFDNPKPRWLGPVAQLILKPKVGSTIGKHAEFDQIEVRISKATGLIKFIKLDLGGGNFKEIYFKKPNTKIKLPRSTFKI